MRKFKVTRKILMGILLVLASSLVLMGVLNGLFHLVTDSDVMDKVYNFIVFAALGIFVWSRKLGKDEAAAAAKEKEEAEAEARPAEITDDKIEIVAPTDSDADKGASSAEKDD